MPVGGKVDAGSHDAVVPAHGDGISLDEFEGALEDGVFEAGACGIAVRVDNTAIDGPTKAAVGAQGRRQPPGLVLAQRPGGRPFDLQ